MILTFSYIYCFIIKVKLEKSISLNQPDHSWTNIINGYYYSPRLFRFDTKIYFLMFKSFYTVPSVLFILISIHDGRYYITEAFYVEFCFFFYDFISCFCFLGCEIAGVFAHDFINWIYWLFRILFPFRIENIRLCVFKCCYLILLCSGIGEPPIEGITVFCRDVTFKANAFAISFCYWPDKATAVRCEG